MIKQICISIDQLLLIFIFLINIFLITINEISRLILSFKVKNLFYHWLGFLSYLFGIRICPFVIENILLS